MIYVTRKLESIEPGKRVKVDWGGNGAGIATGAIGTTITKPEKELHWPDYAGELVENAVCFVAGTFQGQPIVFGLARGCQLTEL